MATSSTTSATFTGTSSYAQDLQSAINRALSFANLPVQILQNKQAELTNQQSALSTLTSKFQALDSAVLAIDTAVSSSSFSATTSDDTIATATATSAAKAGHYTVNVASLGSQTNAISTPPTTTITDPAKQNLGTATSYTLQVDGSSYTVSAGSSLNDLADAINASGAAVTATVINIGGTTSPDYRLSLLGKDYAPTTLHLKDSGGTDTLNTLSAGAYVTYQVNGQPSTPINSNTRALSFAAGLTVTALQTGSTTVDVTPSSSNLSSGLSLFASTYNAAIDELAKSRGQANGPLSGESIISSLTQNLRAITAAGNSSVGSLSDLGLTFDQNGHLSFDSAQFSASYANHPSAISSFLGSSKSGFLATAEDTLTSIVDSTTGSIPQYSKSVASQLTNLATKISDDNDRITILKNSLITKMNKADSAIASLESQKTYYINLFAQEQANQRSNG